MKYLKNCVSAARQGLFSLFGLGAICLALSSCTPSGGTTGSGGASGSGFNSNHPAVKSRNALIAQEPPGNYYYGRRWWTDGTRFWGYLRKPGQTWAQSKLVIMNESIIHQPDRVPEEGVERRHGYDHNFEYKLWGSFTGKTAYDPNSNFILPVFRLSKYELVSDRPGFLFHPGETYSPNRLPPKHPPVSN